MEALRRKYPKGGYALFENAGNSTGWRNNGYADAIVVQLWPSRGIEAYGFEVKVDRADWQRELAKPKKAEAFQKYCSRWWLVAANKCALESEVPKRWGLMEFKANKLYVVRDAPKLKPSPMDISMLAALMRRGHESIDALCQQHYRRGRQEGELKGPEEHRLALEKSQAEVAKLQRSLDAFESESGLRIDRWTAGRLGETVRALMMHRHTLTDPLSHLRQAVHELTRLSKGAQQSLEDLELAMKQNAEKLPPC